MSARGTPKRDGDSLIRRKFPIGHVLVEVIDHSTYGITFGLKTLFGPDDRRDLFSGHVEAQMADELRALADHLDTLKHKIGT